MITPRVILISSKFDFSTDFICLNLHKKGIPYIRLNRDQLEEYFITLNPLLPELVIQSEEYTYQVTADTRFSVYYRAPTFLREIFHHNISEEEQLYKTQWAAFVRSLLLFDDAKWMNDPAITYSAEMKPLQLLSARRIGLNVPKTLVN